MEWLSSFSSPFTAAGVCLSCWADRRSRTRGQQPGVAGPVSSLLLEERERASLIAAAVRLDFPLAWLLMWAEHAYEGRIVGRLAIDNEGSRDRFSCFALGETHAR